MMMNPEKKDKGNTTKNNAPNDNVNLLPSSSPSQPGVLQLIAMQTHVLQGMSHALANLQQALSNLAPRQAWDKSEMGVNTRSPIFIQAEEWLEAIEKRLDVAKFNDREKVHYASQQLFGKASDWWDAYMDAHEDPWNITWVEFKNNFISHHGYNKQSQESPASEPVYLQSSLSNSATKCEPHHWCTIQRTDKSCREAQPRDPSHQGLTLLSPLHDSRLGLDCCNREKARNEDDILGINIEDWSITYSEFKPRPRKRKWKSLQRHQGESSSQFNIEQVPQLPIKEKLTIIKNTTYMKGSMQEHRLNNGCSVNKHDNDPKAKTRHIPITRSLPIKRHLPHAKAAQDYQDPHQKLINKQHQLIQGSNCQEMGHHANNCPKEQHGLSLAQGTHQKQPQQVEHGRINHVTVESIQYAPDVVICTIFINSNPATVVFDSRASHSFISRKCAAGNNMPMLVMKNKLLVTTPGGKKLARHICPMVGISIRGVDFPSNLIVLELKGIDVILGIDWMTKYDGVVEHAKKLLRVKHPGGTKVECQIMEATMEEPWQHINAIKA